MAVCEGFFSLISSDTSVFIGTDFGLGCGLPTSVTKAFGPPQSNGLLAHLL